MSLSRALDDLYGRPGDFLRRLRSELMLHKRTRYSLAKAAGIHPSHVYRYFNGEVTPRVDTMIRLDEAMGRMIESG